MPAAAHVYEIFVNAPPERVWQALIDPEFTRRYFHGTRFESEFGSGTPYRNVLGDGRVAVDGLKTLLETGEAMPGVDDAGLEGFDRGYAHEARARALALLGRLEEATVERDAARGTSIDDPEDRAIFDGDLAAPPWFDLPVG